MSWSTISSESVASVDDRPGSGSVAFDEPLDTDGDLLPDTTFLELITDIELILGDFGAQRHELRTAKSLAEIVNLLDKEDPDCD